MGHTDAAAITEKFVITPEGEQWLQGNPDFVERLDLFYASPKEGERVFNNLVHLGTGQNSSVHRCGEIAVKVSTPTTGSDSYKYGGADIKPENLFNQFAFLTELGVKLEGSGITVPRQYFALSGSNGYVRAEQYMAGWKPLNDILWKHPDYTESEQLGIAARAKERVLNAFSGMALKRSLDLGCTAQCNNILVPVDAPDIESAPICVVDQPSSKFARNIVAGFMTKRLDMQYGRLSTDQPLALAA